MTDRISVDDILENSSENAIGLIYNEEQRSAAMYFLKDQHLFFYYDPNSFVPELYEEEFESAQSKASNQPLNQPLSLIHFWSKEDYVTLKSAGSEIGDFPPKLKLSVHENLDKLSLEDWIKTEGEVAFQSEVENVKKSNTKVALGEAWTFSYTSLFKYDNVVFKNTEDQVVVVSLGLPVRDASSDLETTEDDENYLAALSVLIETIVPTMTVTDNETSVSD